MPLENAWIYQLKILFCFLDTIGQVIRLWNNNEDEDNSPNILCNKNYQASSRNLDWIVNGSVSLFTLLQQFTDWQKIIRHQTSKNMEVAKEIYVLTHMFKKYAS